MNDCDEQNRTDFFEKGFTNISQSLPHNYSYTLFEKSCVDGADLYERSEGDIFGCAYACQLEQACMGFEYYVDYGGPTERTIGTHL